MPTDFKVFQRRVLDVIGETDRLHFLYRLFLGVFVRIKVPLFLRRTSRKLVQCFQFSDHWQYIGYKKITSSRTFFRVASHFESGYKERIS